MSASTARIRRKLASARRKLELPLAWATRSEHRGPTTAIIATTLNCNARCAMCDIWKNRIRGELAPEELSDLPPSLRDINLSGGEPFLRKDLSAMVEVLHRACPRARLVISTNGFLPERMAESLREIVALDPHVGVRVSIDGFGDKHDEIRGVPGGFDRASRALDVAREAGVDDLGVGVTLMDSNREELEPVSEWASSRGLEVSVTVVTSSPIFFGDDKHVADDNRGELARALRRLADRDAGSASPKRWMRGWFEGKLAEYVLTGERPIPCDAGDGFFYLDSMGTVYACHVRDIAIGNIREQPFATLWAGAAAERARQESRGCSGCFMVCTTKSQIARRLPTVAAEIGRDLLRARLA